MADYSQELRVKVTDDMHADFHAICTANSEDASERLRRLVKEDIAKEVHRNTLLNRLLRGNGTAAESKGK